MTRVVHWPDRLTAAPQALFAYGTLQFPEVLHALIGRMPEHRPAAVDGWRVAGLPGRDYPGLVPGPARAAGLLLRGLSDAEWRVLDAFEDEWYDLRELILTDGGTAWCYTCPSGYRVSELDWTAEVFSRASLGGFVESSAAWRSTLDQGMTGQGMTGQESTG
ncbi:gamma-glutamylcyclotransferase family protein [Actinomadura scrupuli]|uniref:gamma-glutamylcyclotransferase family protein n=1 Tax=Actinomadura scrupuli TaxID=559629 RepID=UPI003D968077